MLYCTACVKVGLSTPSYSLDSYTHPSQRMGVLKLSYNVPPLTGRRYHASYQKFIIEDEYSECLLPNKPILFPHFKNAEMQNPNCESTFPHFLLHNIFSSGPVYYHIHPTFWHQWIAEMEYVHFMPLGYFQCHPVRYKVSSDMPSEKTLSTTIPIYPRIEDTYKLSRSMSSLSTRIPHIAFNGSHVYSSYYNRHSGRRIGLLKIELLSSYNVPAFVGGQYHAAYQKFVIEDECSECLLPNKPIWYLHFKNAVMQDPNSESMFSHFLVHNIVPSGAVYYHIHPTFWHQWMAEKEYIHFMPLGHFQYRPVRYKVSSDMSSETTLSTTIPIYPHIGVTYKLSRSMSSLSTRTPHIAFNRPHVYSSYTHSDQRIGLLKIEFLSSYNVPARVGGRYHAAYQKFIIQNEYSVTVRYKLSSSMSSLSTRMTIPSHITFNGDQCSDVDNSYTHSGQRMDLLKMCTSELLSSYNVPPFMGGRRHAAYQKFVIQTENKYSIYIGNSQYYPVRYKLYSSMSTLSTRIPIFPHIMFNEDQCSNVYNRPAYQGWCNWLVLHTPITSEEFSYPTVSRDITSLTDIHFVYLDIHFSVLYLLKYFSVSHLMKTSILSRLTYQNRWNFKVKAKCQSFVPHTEITSQEFSNPTIFRYVTSLRCRNQLRQSGFCYNFWTLPITKYTLYKICGLSLPAQFSVVHLWKHFQLTTYFSFCPNHNGACTLLTNFNKVLTHLSVFAIQAQTSCRIAFPVFLFLQSQIDVSFCDKPVPCYSIIHGCKIAATRLELQTVISPCFISSAVSPIYTTYSTAQAFCIPSDYEQSCKSLPNDIIL